MTLEIVAPEIRDHVPADSGSAREIGFTIPDRYNASRILFDNLAKGRGAQLCRTLRGSLPLGKRF
jgi:hypothetical protein